MLWHTIRIVYFIIWLALLIHCLRSKRLFPILENLRLTKVLWCLTFVFVNPLLTLLYFIYGVCLKPFATEKKRMGHTIASIIAIFMLALILVIFEVPRPRENQQTPTQGLLDIEIHAGVLKSQNNINHSFASGNNSLHTRFADQQIIIFCDEKHELMHRVAQSLKKQLSEQVKTRKVTIASMSKSIPLNPTRNPNIVIRLVAETLREYKSPLGRKLDVTLTCQAGNSLYPSNYFTNHTFTPPILNFSFNGSQQHRSEFFGMESISAQYQKQADNIAQELAEALTQQFTEWTEEYGRLPHLPDYLYGNPKDRSALTFPDPNIAQLLITGPGLLIQNHSVWLIPDERPTVEAFTILRDHFQQQGFKGGEWLDNEEKRNQGTLRMEKDHEDITIHRQKKRMSPGVTYIHSSNKTAPRLPLVVHHTTHFSMDQGKKALQQFLDSETDLETLLIFEEAFREADLNHQFYPKLENQPVHTTRAALSLARYYHRQKRPEQAKAAFLQARVLTHLEKEHNPYNNRFKKLAKDLKDESLLKHPLTLDSFIQAGFIDLTHQTEPHTIEAPYHTPPMFCVQTSKGQIATIAQQFTPSTLEDGTPSYKFTRIIKTENSSQTGSSDPYSPHVYVHIQDYGDININIKPTSTDHFKFTAQARPTQ